jgi:hypothetical protein
MQRIRIRIFRDERTRSTLLDSKSCFGVFRTVTLLHEVRYKAGGTSAINALVCTTKSRRNFSQRTHLIHPIGTQTHVLGRFGPFHYCTNFDAKRAKLVRLMHMLGPRNRFRIFCNERTRSTLFEPKLMFWGILDYSLLHELRCKMG